jgi:hypothetical protein
MDSNISFNKASFRFKFFIITAACYSSTELAPNYKRVIICQSYFGENCASEDQFIRGVEFDDRCLLIVQSFVFIEYHVESVAPDDNLQLVKHHGCADVPQIDLI